MTHRRPLRTLAVVRVRQQSDTRLDQVEPVVEVHARHGVPMGAAHDHDVAALVEVSVRDYLHALPDARPACQARSPEILRQLVLVARRTVSASSSRATESSRTRRLAGNTSSQGQPSARTQTTLATRWPLMCSRWATSCAVSLRMLTLHNRFPSDPRACLNPRCCGHGIPPFRSTPAAPCSRFGNAAQGAGTEPGDRADRDRSRRRRGVPTERLPLPERNRVSPRHPPFFQAFRRCRRRASRPCRSDPRAATAWVRRKAPFPDLRR